MVDALENREIFSGHDKTDMRGTVFFSIVMLEFSGSVVRDIVKQYVSKLLSF